MGIVGAGEQSKNFSDLVTLIVRRLVELSVGEQRVEDAEVGVTQRHKLVRQIK